MLYTTDCCLSGIILHGKMSSCFHLEHHCRYYIIKQVCMYFINNACSYQVKSQYFHRLAAQERGITLLITELMFNEPQNHPGLLPRCWTEFLSFVTKPSLCYLCPKIEITKQRQLDHKDKSANLGIYHVKSCAPQHWGSPPHWRYSSCSLTWFNSLNLHIEGCKSITYDRDLCLDRR